MMFIATGIDHCLVRLATTLRRLWWWHMTGTRHYKKKLRKKVGSNPWTDGERNAFEE
jgi:hypothetical protein